MTLKTYYAKLDCYSNPAITENISNEYYKSFCDFMSTLTGSGVATLVSWNSGANAVSASFDNRTYWDGAARFGVGAHSLWRFNATPERNFDWYLYTQVVSASFNLNQTFNTPISGYGQDGGLGGVTTNRGIYAQAAVCFSGSTSFNPWNGSISDGNGNASLGAGNGSARWVSGSNDRILYVLPRSNDLGGAHVIQKSNGLSLGRYFPANTTNLRYGFICDGDALLAFNGTDASNTYGISYIGPYEARRSLSGSGIAGTSHGFMMIAQQGSTTNTLDRNQTFGSTTGNASTDGGVAFPVSDLVSGSKLGVVNVFLNFNLSLYHPNTVLGQYDELPYFVGFAETPFLGMAGNVNGGLMRLVRNVQSHDTTADFKRAIIGGDLTISNIKIAIPWNGTSPPGTSTSRTGSNFTWTQDYG
jgi:hypothetical protein